MGRILRVLTMAIVLLSACRVYAAEKVVLCSLKVVNTDLETAAAVSMNLISDINANGFWIVDSDTAKNAAVTLGSDESATGETIAPVELAKRTGASFFITGSLVKLGNETTLALELHRQNGTIVAAKKVVAKDDSELPKAVQTIAAHMAEDMRDRTVAQTASSTRAQTPPREAPRAAPQQVAPKNAGRFEKNFGLSIGQFFRLRDEAYSFTSFEFNGRFEFNRLLFITNAGFGFGNKDFENGFHFKFDLALAGYLRKEGQVTPYMGAGVGLGLGNLLDPCADFEPEKRETTYGTYYNTYCEAEGQSDIVTWKVFPVVGVEILRTFRMRLHIELRYLIVFNSSGQWGHGPMPILGVAF